MDLLYAFIISIAVVLFIYSPFFKKFLNALGLSFVKEEIKTLEDTEARYSAELEKIRKGKEYKKYKTEQEEQEKILNYTLQKKIEQINVLTEKLLARKKRTMEKILENILQNEKELNFPKKISVKFFGLFPIDEIIFYSTDAQTRKNYFYSAKASNWISEIFLQMTSKEKTTRMFCISAEKNKKENTGWNILFQDNPIFLQKKFINRNEVHVGICCEKSPKINREKETFEYRVKIEKRKRKNQTEKDFLCSHVWLNVNEETFNNLKIKDVLIIEGIQQTLNHFKPERILPLQIQLNDEEKKKLFPNTMMSVPLKEIVEEKTGKNFTELEKEYLYPSTNENPLDNK